MNSIWQRRSYTRHIIKESGKIPHEKLKIVFENALRFGGSYVE